MADFFVQLMLQVNPESGAPYEVYIGQGQLKAEMIPQENFEHLVILTECQVYALYTAKIKGFQASLSKPTTLIVLDRHGESVKDREVKAQVEDQLLAEGLTKKTLLIAVGGGTLGDLGGFVAATYYRGISFVQVPTTLLSMVDSSVGGKTAVNSDYGKNLIGAFHQPIRVVIDLSFLETLESRDFASGMAEVIKIAATSSRPFFEYLEKSGASDISEVIQRAVALKAGVVAQDEKDGGLRNILNFGHTVGHAIESSQSLLRHGECVSIGIVYECLCLRFMGRLSNTSFQRIEKLLRAHGLPTELPQQLNWSDLLPKLRMDKKNQGGQIYLVDLPEIGITGPQHLMAVPEKVLSPLLSQVLCLHQENPAISGSVQLPGSKSLSNRALILAVLSGGGTRICNLTPSEDIRVMLSALQAMGVPLKFEDSAHEGLDVEVGSYDGFAPDKGQVKTDNLEIWVENAGTVARFLTPVLALHLLNHEYQQVNIDGNVWMRQRPIRDLVDALVQALPVKVQYHGEDGCLPISLARQENPQTGDFVEVNNEKSSQFVSGLLLVLPFLGKRLQLTQKVESGQLVVSQVYIEMTIRLMKVFGVQVESSYEKSRLSYQVKGGYQPVRQYQVEPDASAASYPLAMAALTGGKVTVNLASHDLESPLQGEAKFIRVLQHMGCQVETGDTTTCVGPPGGLKFTEENMEECTDSFLTAAVLMAAGAGGVIRGIANQRVKECNRIRAICQNLQRLGCPARELEDGLEIPGVSGWPSDPQVCQVHHDHRMAMALSILSLKRPNLRLPDWRCVEKTFSNFFEVFTQLGASLSGAPPSLTPGRSGRKVVLCGMRNAGKTFVGAQLAEARKLPFYDLDEEIQKLHGPIPNLMVEASSFEGRMANFRKIEQLVMADLISRPEFVLALGGGTLDQADFHVFQDCQLIFVRRHDEDVLAEESPGKPAFDQDPRLIFERRLPLYLKADQVFTFPPRSRFQGEDYWPAVGRAFVQLFGGSPPLSPLPATFACLTQSQYSVDFLQTLPVTEIFEIRVDKMREPTDQDLQSLAYHFETPTIFTFRTEERESPWNYRDLQTHWIPRFLKLGLPMLDVELGAFDELMVEVLQKYETPLIVSLHRLDPRGSQVRSQVKEDLQKMEALVGLLPQIRVFKLVYSEETLANVITFMEAAQTFGVSRPLIRLSMGTVGQVSRVLNPQMTPVSWGPPAAPGQLSAPTVADLKGQLGVPGL